MLRILHFVFVHRISRFVFVFLISFSVGLNVSKNNNNPAIMTEQLGDIALIGLAVMGQVTFISNYSVCRLMGSRIMIAFSKWNLIYPN
jgi:hypothetical protein